MATVESKSVYFTHDSNAFSDPKILKLKRTHGIEGYGIFFALLEKLSASNAYRISIKNIEDLAYDMRVETAKLQDIIDNYDLFKQETDDTGTYFYSHSHRLKMQYKDNKADKKRLAGLARMANLSPEELSAQNTKAINSRWEKEREEKAKSTVIPAVVVSDTIKIPVAVVSDTLNKDKDRNTDKNKNENKYKDQNKEQNLSSVSSGFSSSERIKNVTPNVQDFSSLFFTGNTQSKVKEFYLDFINDKEERKSLKYNQFEKVYVVLLESIYVNSQRVMTKENLYEEINNSKSPTLSMNHKNKIDTIIKLLKSEPKYLEEFNQVCQKFRLSNTN
jgi:hypothetical protein